MMQWPRFMTTIHFRVSALFLLLLLIGGLIYYKWIDATVFSPQQSSEENRWFAELAAVELDSLAAELQPWFFVPGEFTERLSAYGAQIDHYDAEILVTDAAGRVMSCCVPESLAIAVGQVNPALLDSMAMPDWDWTSYPVPGNLDAYENRIIEVNPLWAGGDSTQVPDGYLVASFRPVTVSVEELSSDKRKLVVHALVVLLVNVALVGLIIMAWLVRRITRLREGVNAFAGGDLARRVPATSPDELGDLGRQFNAMAARLESLVEELRQKESFQRQLIANISHDLRTPMASLRGYVETLVLQRDRLDPADRDRYLDIVAGNLNHLDRLVEHLLRLSRLDAGQMPFNFEEFPLQELVEEVVARCTASARERGITLNCSVEPDLPLVEADPLQIAQVLQNLVENAIKFNREGGEVHVDVIRDTDGVAVTVRDTGVGIDGEDLPRIFDRFYVADKSRSRKGQSSGLGLAIAQKIVAGHGGELRVVSQLGKGAAFSFVLRAARSSDAPLPAGV